MRSTARASQVLQLPPERDQHQQQERCDRAGAASLLGDQVVQGNDSLAGVLVDQLESSADRFQLGLRPLEAVVEPDRLSVFPQVLVMCVSPGPVAGDP